jgi:phosphoenolpyruvate phosphomutase-like protein
MRSVAAAVDLPVTVDLENGWAATPEGVAETVLLAGTTGIVGGSIEDTTGGCSDPFYPLEVAVERLRAASMAARALPFRFALTARPDQYMHGRPNLAKAVARVEQVSAQCSIPTGFVAHFLNPKGRRFRLAARLTESCRGGGVSGRGRAVRTGSIGIRRHDDWGNLHFVPH